MATPIDDGVNLKVFCVAECPNALSRASQGLGTLSRERERGGAFP